MPFSDAFARWVRDLAVGRKLALGFGAVGLVTIILAAATFVSINDLSDATDLGQAAGERHDAANKLNSAAAHMRAEQLSYVAADGLTRSTYEASTRDFEQALGQLRLYASTPAEQSLITKIATGYLTFLATDQFIWDEVQTGNLETAQNFTLSAASLNFGFMAADTEQFATQAQIDQDRANLVFDAHQDQAWLRSAAMGVLALALVAIASRYITHQIRDPLLSLQVAAQQASSGDLETSVDIHSQDEIGRLAESFNTMMRELSSRELSLLDEQRKQQRSGELHTALELTESEGDIYRVTHRVLESVAPDRCTELLVAENSRSALERVTVAGPNPDGPGCCVAEPYRCPAVRASKPMSFSTSSALDACPHLIDRPGEPRSAVCVPVSFMGRATGVLHSTGADGETLTGDLKDTLVTLADAAGSRIGMTRSTAQTKKHATTDSLTGLPNRRAFEQRVRTMHRNGDAFTLVVADLDHFKLLNDAHGHEAGDQALRLYADVIVEGLREGDAAARWGGEEFTIALFHTDSDATQALLERLSSDLAAKITSHGSTPFTASYGYVNAAKCSSFEMAMRLADGALYEAKEAGRDRAVGANAPGLTGPLTDPDDLDPLQDLDADLADLG